MPRYEDYHRTVIGYHGTRLSTARRLVLGEGSFDASQNDDDWLGHGIYFWEYAPQQAWLWAQDRSRKNGWDEEIAVVASMIRLGNCFDLLDPENVKDLGRLYQSFIQFYADSDIPPPTNVRSSKRLNCAVFEESFDLLARTDQEVDTVRAVFVPSGSSDRLWRGSGINAHAHIQVNVRNRACILGTWLIRPDQEQAHGHRRKSTR